MISDFEELRKLFEEIDGAISKTNFYVIGGAVLLRRGLKEVTKDIDVIVDSREEFLLTQKGLRKLGFTTKIPTRAYQHVELSQIFVRGVARIDLFDKVVCEGFSLSEAMKMRSERILELKHLSVYLCSDEDVFLFKTFTEREGDITDCLALASRRPLDWKAIPREPQSQVKKGSPVWISWVGERFDVLQDRGLAIPIMKEVDRLRERYYDQLEKSLEKQ